MAKEQQESKAEGVKKPPGNKPTPPRTKLAQQAKNTELKTAPPKIDVQGKVIRKDEPDRKAVPTNGTHAEVQQETIPISASNKQPGKQKLAPKGKTIVSPKVAPTLVGGSNSSAGAGAGEKAASMLGDYKLLKKLGQGGMGAVYKAQKVGETDIVAIKVLSKELSNKEAYVLRFQREGRVMKKLDHPNVLRCFDVGQAKNYYYITIEYVEGGSIEGWLKKLGRFSVGDALHIVLKTAAGLQHAHEMSLIHRDIKPDNILLTADGVIKVADLGLAKDTDEDHSLTKTGAGAGTPIYMAPEQAHDVKHVDSRVDIYALGVMLYVFLTGQPPFSGATLVDVIGAKEKGKFDPIRKHNSEVPAKLDLIVDKMMAKDARHRYASCEEVIAALEPLGLANDHLSFLAPEAPEATEEGIGEVEEEAEEEATKPAVKRPAKPAATSIRKPSASTQAPAKPSSAGKTRGPGQAGANTNIAEEEVVSKDVWYWQIKTPGGKVVVRKVTTDQIKMLIKSNSINAEHQLSKKEKSGFRSIASYPEFAALFQNKDTVNKAKSKSKKFDDAMKDIAAADARKRKWGWLGRMFKGAGGFLFGLFWIVLILGAVGAGGWYAFTQLMK